MLYEAALYTSKHLHGATSFMPPPARSAAPRAALQWCGARPAADEENMCVVCFDAPKEYAIVPCGHQCVCAGCAEQLTKTRTPMCPVCRGPIRETMKVFC
jgi:hypothetical protein